MATRVLFLDDPAPRGTVGAPVRVPSSHLPPAAGACGGGSCPSPRTVLPQRLLTSGCLGPLGPPALGLGCVHSLEVSSNSQLPGEQGDGGEGAEGPALQAMAPARPFSPGPRPGVTLRGLLLPSRAGAVPTGPRGPSQDHCAYPHSERQTGPCASQPQDLVHILRRSQAASSGPPSSLGSPQAPTT